jgi:hypothetical protein
MNLISKRKGLSKKKKNNGLLWEIVEDIKVNKTGTLLDDENYLKEFNPFIVLRALSMDPDLLFFTNFVNSIHSSLDKKQLYKILVKMIPVTEKRCRWIKNESVENPTVDCIMNYYECNRREATMYYEMFGKEWAEQIESQFGGLRNHGE